MLYMLHCYNTVVTLGSLGLDVLVERRNIVVRVLSYSMFA